MIPSVEERQIRPCETCHCYWEATCPHDGIGCSINGPRTENYGDNRDRNYMFKDNSDKIPCIHHITKDEFIFLITRFISGHVRSEDEIQDKLNEYYKAQKNACPGASNLLSAKIQVAEWVLQIDYASIENRSRREQQKLIGCGEVLAETPVHIGIQTK